MGIYIKNVRKFREKNNFFGVALLSFDFLFFNNSKTKSLIELFLCTYLMPLVIGIHMSNESKIGVDKNFGPKNTQGFLSIYDVFLAKIFVDSDFALINFGGSNDQWY